jgi:hypothetical protein
MAKVQGSAVAAKPANGAPKPTGATGKAAAKPVVAPITSPGPGPKAAKAPPPAAPALRHSELIMACLKEAKGKPVTVRQVTEDALRRGFVTSGNSAYRAVESGVQELRKKGVVGRAKDGSGWILVPAGKATAEPKRVPTPVAPAVAKSAKPSTNAVGSATSPAKRDGANGQPSLRQYVLGVLKRARRPLPLKDLVAKVLAEGYQSSSKDFANVVGVLLKKMPEVRRVPDEGYALTNGRG